MIPAGAATPALVRGNASLVVDVPHTAWLVESGQVAVFRVRVRDGVPVGPRRYCCSCQPGHALFGDPGSVADERFRFVAVGIEDARLVPLTAAALEHLLRETPEQAANLIDTWVEKLGTLLGREQPDTPVAGANPDAGELQLEDGQVFRPPWRTTCWVRIDAGNVQLLGMRELYVAASPTPFPLGSEAWFKAVGPVRVTVCRTTDLPNAETILQGIGPGEQKTIDFTGTWIATASATPGLYEIALRVADPSIPQRRLASGYYMRQVQIDQV